MPRLRATLTMHAEDDITKPRSQRSWRLCFETDFLQEQGAQFLGPRVCNLFLFNNKEMVIPT